MKKCKYEKLIKNMTRLQLARAKCDKKPTKIDDKNTMEALNECRQDAVGIIETNTLILVVNRIFSESLIDYIIDDYIPEVLFMRPNITQIHLFLGTTEFSYQLKLINDLRSVCSRYLDNHKKLIVHYPNFTGRYDKRRPNALKRLPERVKRNIIIDGSRWETIGVFTFKYELRDRDSYMVKLSKRKYWTKDKEELI